MSRIAIRRSRLVAATVLSLAGTFAAGAVVSPAQAECTKASVWVYESQEGRDYKYGPEQCVGPDDTVGNWHRVGWGTEDDTYPKGTPTGVGFMLWF